MAEMRRDAVGSVRIANEVVGLIATLAATEIDGVVKSGTSANTGFAGLLNKNRGVKVEVGEKEAAVDLYLSMEYGHRLPDVATAVQENVKKAIESMTGLDVVEVNVHIQGVQFQDENSEERVR